MMGNPTLLLRVKVQPMLSLEELCFYAHPPFPTPLKHFQDYCSVVWKDASKMPSK